MVEVADAPLIADHPEIPAELALRASTPSAPTAPRPRPARGLLEALEFEPVDGDGWEARGEERGGLYVYDEPPAERGLQGAGSVHHVAWASTHRRARGVAASGRSRAAPTRPR